MMTDGTKFFKAGGLGGREKNPHTTRCSLRYRGSRPYTLHSHGWDSREGEAYEIDQEIKFCPECGRKLIRPRKTKPKTMKQIRAEAKRVEKKLEKFCTEFESGLLRR